jgi:cell surface protein SprA
VISFREESHPSVSGVLRRLAFFLWAVAALVSVAAFRSLPHPPLIAPAAFPLADSLDGLATSVDSTLSQTSELDSVEIPAFIPEEDSGAAVLDSTFRFQPDSALAGDTARVDSAHVEPIDSSARVEHFRYPRRDIVSADPFPRRLSPFYLKNSSPSYTRELSIDSTGTIVTIREVAGKANVKIPITMTLDDYITKQLDYENRRRWEGLTGEYRLVDKTDALASVFGTITNIDIPVPANPLFSIFGPPRINLRISGAVDIRAAYRTQRSDQTQISRYDQVRNEPDFNQEVQINVNGTIGDKLNIVADWNTQRVFEYENQLKIKYTGYEDEIVQSIEAGNVSLPTPSTFVGSSQALFGIKAKLQTGPLTLTTLLSQKKGQTRELTASGGAQERTFEIRPFQYSTNHYFLDTVYRKFYEPLKGSIIPTYSAEMQFWRVKDIEVWVSQPLGQQPRPEARSAIAYIDLPPRAAGTEYDTSYRNQQTQIPGRVQSTNFIKLNPSDYILREYLGYITLSTSVQDQQIIAVAMRTEGPTPYPNDDVFYGEFSGNDTTQSRLVLKLVKPQNLLSSHRPAWDLLLKNIYSLGGRDLKKEGFELDVWRVEPGAEDRNMILGERLLKVLDLDRFDQNNALNSDNTFDFIPGLTVDQARAEIVFPTLEPFRTNIRRLFASVQVPSDSSDYIYSDVYDTSQTAAAQNTIRNRYVIRGKSSTQVTARYQLGFNLVEGSVRVLLNGAPLTQNVDYTIDYITGEVVIRNQNALVPGANLQIKYEQNDLFQLAAKTLIGVRGELSPFANTQLGFTVMNLNQATLSDKVRLGEEPTSNTIFGLDGSTTISLQPLTTALDALPLYQTREPSSLRLSGEVAYMNPDPNTKKSGIPSDQGAAVAYIDDFEGARRTIPLGVAYTTWKQASPPVISFQGMTSVALSTDSKAKLNWYNILPSDVLVTDIWHNRSVRRGDERQTVLNLDFYPARRGMHNYTLSDSTMNPPGRNWDGVMKFLTATGSNILDQNISFLEIWMKADGASLDDIRRGRLHVNLGMISEDVIPDRRLNSEDLVVNQIANGILNPGEDVGLDMLTDAEERARYSELVQRYPELAGDPSGDNYSYSTGSANFDAINGTENSQQSAGGNFPDTEDLNNNFQLDLVNSYLEYEIPLDTVYYADTTSQQPRNPYWVGGGENRWYQFRIPLLNPTRVMSQGNESPQDVLQNLQYVRMWLSGFSQDVRIRIADISLVGNQWQEVTQSDSVLKVSVVNIEDNPRYTSPPGVFRERDKTQPDQEILGNEQSLALILKKLGIDEYRQVVKNYTVRPLDVFNYRAMKMFVYGDPQIQFVDTNDYDAAIFLRFGADTMNFYEYRQPIRPGWEGNDVEVNFAELSSIKALRQLRGDSVNVLSLPLPVTGRPGAEYRIKGNPALSMVRAVWVGIVNTSSRRQPPAIPRTLSGEIWINELRLVDVDDEPGIAYRFDTQLKLADLGNLTFNYSKIDPNFHGLDQRFGSRTTTVNWGLGVTLGFEKFFPASWQGTSVPFAYSHTENLVKPKYMPNTDIEVDEAVSRARTPEEGEQIRTATQTLRISDTYAVPNLRLGLPSNEWYIRDTFNKLALSGNYTISRERSPVTEQRIVWTWAGQMGYAVTLPADYYIQPFKSLFDGVFLFNEFKDWKLYYAPTGFSGSIGATRSQTREQARGVGGDRPISRLFTATRSMGFGYKLTEGGLTNLSGEYGLNIESNLAHLETDFLGQQRPFSRILKDIFFQDRFINFGNDARYSQRFTTNSRPKIPPILSLDKFSEFTFGYSVNYNWQNNFQRGDLDKAAGFDNNISMSLSFRLKAFTDPWFPSGEPAGGVPPRSSDGRSRRPGIGRDIEDESGKAGSQTGGEQPAGQDSTSRSKESEEPSGVSGLAAVGTALKYLIKTPLLEYENISISFTQTNRVTSPGVVGGPGFRNFWGRIPFFQEQIPEYGPTRLYQLGIISDPSGKLKFMKQSKFPFFGFETELGPRAANATLNDAYGQSNKLSFRTSRALWEGASIDLNWNVGWTFNKSTNILTDSLGTPLPTSVTTSGSVERSYFTLPPVLFFKVFKSNLEDVSKKYSEMRRSSSDTRTDDEKLAQAFEDGFEALPVFKKILGPYVPRVNYTLRWDGLERLIGASGYVDRLGLEHAYASTFTRAWRGNPDGGERTEAERVVYGFSPLVGVSVTMKELLKGSVTASLRFNSNTSYDLNVPARNIVETFSQEISLSLGYNRRGFEFFLFGASLSNDMDISTTYSRSKNSRRTYEVNTLEANQTGTPLEGSTRTVVEPRIRYVLSSRVTASIYYRYTKTAPDEGGSLIPGTTINEAGLDIHIAIQ